MPTATLGSQWFANAKTLGKARRPKLKVANLFSYILGQVSHINFQKLTINTVQKHHVRRFLAWTRFVTMHFYHLAR